MIKKEMENNTPWILNSNDKITVLPQELYCYIKENENLLVTKKGSEKGVTLYKYIDNKYQLFTESECKAFIKSFIPDKIRRASHWESVYKEFMSENTNINVSEFNSNTDIINFSNGIYNIKTGELLEHSPEYYTTIQIPCNWNGDLTLEDAPVFNRFLNDLTSGNEEDKRTLLEIMGLIISNVEGSKFKKLLILKGLGNTGKSQLRELVISIIGQENSHSIEIRQLSERFGLAELDGKRLAGYGDLPDSKIASMDKIKELTGGDTTRGEVKYNNGYQFKYKGFLWFNCNNLPSFSGDRGDWVFDRFIIISCENSIPKEKQDENIRYKMLNEKEAIVSVAIKHLKEALNRGCLTESSNVKNNRIQYSIEANSILKFIQDQCVLYVGQTRRSVFNEEYKTWCKNNQLFIEPAKTVSEELRKLNIEPRKSGEFYYNLQLKT